MVAIRQSRPPRSILITGASSGLGAALAAAYAAPGVTLALCGRNAARLAAVGVRCGALGAEVTQHRLDVTDRAAMARAIGAVDGRAPLDLVIANAGISGGSGRDEDAIAIARATFAVNVEGVLNTIEPALPGMLARGRGQLALIASLGAWRGLPSAPAYCASKAAVRSYGEGLRGRLAGRGIGVSVVCPGFVRTGMTAGNPFPMPMLLEADQAARLIRAGLARGRSRIAFPWPLYWAVRLAAALPPAWLDRRLARLPRKE
jgi:short-subunit dehydrogenase